MRRTRLRGSLPARLILVAALTSGCLGAGDMFEVSRRLPGEYRLVQFEVYHYYLADKNSSEEGGGVLGGRVLQIGWNQRHIVAWREAVQGDSGWMIVDLTTRRIQGPMTAVEWASIAARDPAFQGLKIYPIEQAWSMLRR